MLVRVPVRLPNHLLRTTTPNMSICWKIYPFWNKIPMRGMSVSSFITCIVSCKWQDWQKYFHPVLVLLVIVISPSSIRILVYSVVFVNPDWNAYWGIIPDVYWPWIHWNMLRSPQNVSFKKMMNPIPSMILSIVSLPQGLVWPIMPEFLIYNYVDTMIPIRY